MDAPLRSVPNLTAPPQKISKIERILTGISRVIDYCDGRTTPGTLNYACEAIDKDISTLTRKTFSLYSYINNPNEPSHLSCFNECFDRIVEFLAKHQSPDMSRTMQELIIKCREIYAHLNQLNPDLVKIPDALNSPLKNSKFKTIEEIEFDQQHKDLYEEIKHLTSEFNFQNILDRLQNLSRNPQGTQSSLNPLFKAFYQTLERNIIFWRRDERPICWDLILKLHDIQSKSKEDYFYFLANLIESSADVPIDAFKLLINNLHMVNSNRKSDVIEILIVRFMRIAPELSKDTNLIRKLISEVATIPPTIKQSARMAEILKLISKIYPVKDHPVFKLISKVQIDCKDASFTIRYHELFEMADKSEFFKNYINPSYKEKTLLDSEGAIPLHQYDAEVVKRVIDIDLGKGEGVAFSLSQSPVQELIQMSLFAHDYCNSKLPVLIEAIKLNLLTVKQADLQENIELLIKLNNTLHSAEITQFLVYLLDNKFYYSVDNIIDPAFLVEYKSYEIAHLYSSLVAIKDICTDQSTLKLLYSRFLNLFWQADSEIPNIAFFKVQELSLAMQFHEKTNEQASPEPRIKATFLLLLKQNSESLLMKLKSVLQFQPQTSTQDEENFEDFIPISRNQSKQWSITIYDTEIEKIRLSKLQIDKWGQFLGLLINYRKY